MTGSASRRSLLCDIAALPVLGGTALANPPSDLARACHWAIEHTAWINDPNSLDDAWSDERLDAELDRVNAIYKRAITEPSQSLSDLKAKAALMLDEIERNYRDFGDPEYDDERLTLTNLRKVIALEHGGFA